MPLIAIRFSLFAFHPEAPREHAGSPANSDYGSKRSSLAFRVAIAFRRNTEPGLELWEEACHEANRSLSHILDAGLGIYPGITAKEAREKKAAWEAGARP